ncbi:MAG: TRAP transporter small permease [Oceanospirillales bacterium]|nr:TRAP transporter small permease [Oceanospirillales bacterium]MBR9886224.1 TRAP transporter small permease [Oceanospirillales bacterium]
MFVINVCVLLYGVVARYIVGHSPIWMDELSRYLIIGTVLLVLAPAWLENKHMRVEFIENFLPDQLVLVIRIYTWLLMTLLSGYIAWISWEYAFSISRFITMGLSISKTIPFLALPIGFACLCLVSLLKGFELTRYNSDSAKR